MDLSFGATWFISRIILCKFSCQGYLSLHLINSLLTEDPFNNSVMNFKCRTNSIPLLQSTLMCIETLLTSEGPKHMLMWLLSCSRPSHFWSHQVHRMWLRAVTNVKVPKAEYGTAMTASPAVTLVYLRKPHWWGIAMRWELQDCVSLEMWLSRAKSFLRWQVQCVSALKLPNKGSQKKDLKSSAFLVHSFAHATYLIKIHMLNCSFTETSEKKFFFFTQIAIRN